MKDNKQTLDETGFSLTPDESKETGYIQRLLTALILYAGFSGCVWTVLGLGGMGVNPVPLLVIGCAYCAAFCGLRGRWRVISILADIALLVYFYLALSFMADGWNAVSNQVCQTFEVYLGRILPRYAINGEHAVLSAGMFLATASAALAILCGRTAQAAGAFGRLSGLLALGLWAAALIFQVPYPPACAAALIAAAAVLAGTRIPGRRVFYGSGSNGGGNRLLLTIAVLLCVSALISFPLNGLNKNADGARRQAARTIDSFRYDAQEDTAPEGDFSRLSEYPSLSDAEFYKAQSAGDIYYLRGYVGEAYTRDGWVSLEPGRRAEYAELFSWLHDRGFYAQNQQSVLRDALGRDAEAPVEVSVVNAGAYSKYLYAPYEAAVDEPDIYRIGDENLLAGGFRGEREYKFILSGGAVSDYELLYNELNNAFGRGAPNAVEYLRSENGYRNFVYKNYLEIPEEARSSIQDFLGGFIPPEDGLIFRDAKTIADSYISSLPYSDKPEASSYRGDFITDFLAESREGNSLHFSTVETLLFRYLGIPARYVEGYILTEGELETAKNGGAVTISPENLRAWTEIYRDGVGFVPYELDPPEIYLHDQMMTDPMTETEPPEDEPPALHSMLLKILLTVLAVIVILLAVGFAILAIRRAYIRRRYKRILTITDNSEAVSLTTTYLIWVVSHAGIPYKNGSLHDLRPQFEELFGRDMREKYSEVIRIQQQAVFSDLIIHDEERAMVTGFLNEVTGLIGKQASLPRRFRLKWVDCVV